MVFLRFTVGMSVAHMWKEVTGVKCLAVRSVCVVVLGYVFTCYHIGVCMLSCVPTSNFLTLLNC